MEDLTRAELRYTQMLKKTEASEETLREIDKHFDDRRRETSPKTAETINIDPKTRTQLLKARELIRRRDGKAAARLLHQIDHPIARKWEKKINYALDWSRQPDAVPDRGPMPWYLWPFMAMAVLWSMFYWFAATGGLNGNGAGFIVVCFVAYFWPRGDRGFIYARYAAGLLLLLAVGAYLFFRSWS